MYAVQIQYDPTLDYGCGVDMTTRDTLHIADSQQTAEEWMRTNASNIAEQYEDVYPWELMVVSWTIDASWNEDKTHFTLDGD